MKITAKLVSELREKTGAGMMDCKKSLETTKGNIEEAVVLLRMKGLSDIQKREEKTTNEGTIGYYIHAGSKIGVMVVVNSETDFVSKSQPFQDFAHNLAVHIAAANPTYLTKEEVPEAILIREREIALNGVDPTKPEAIKEKIVQGRLQKYYKEVVLMEQSFVKDQNLAITDLLGELASKVGEKIVIKKFVRYSVS